MSVTFSLPKPISVNEAYANAPGRGRYKTAKCKAWQKAAKLELMVQQVARFAPKPPLQMTITLPYSGGRADVCNFEKVLTDTLVDAGVIPDDNDKILPRVTIQTGSPDKTKCFVTVEPMEAV